MSAAMATPERAAIEGRRRDRLRDALDKALGTTEERKRAFTKSSRTWDERGKEPLGDGGFHLTRRPGAE